MFLYTFFLIFVRCTRFCTFFVLVKSFCKKKKFKTVFNDLVYITTNVGLNSGNCIIRTILYSEKEDLFDNSYKVTLQTPLSKVSSV